MVKWENQCPKTAICFWIKEKEREKKEREGKEGEKKKEKKRGMNVAKYDGGEGLL